MKIAPKHIFTALFLFTALLFTGQTFAEPQTTEPILKTEDIRKIREAVETLGSIVKDDASSTSETAASRKSKEVPAKAEPKKNMADVADRTLSILSGYIGTAAAAMQKVAPEVWRVMIRQQYANAIALPLLPSLLLLGVLIFLAITKKGWKNPGNDSEEFWVRFWITTLIPAVLLTWFFIWAAVKFSDSARILINPEYYAFRDLLNLLLNRGGL